MTNEKKYVLKVYGELVWLNQRQFTQAVSDGIKTRCKCGDCLICKAVKFKRELLREEHAASA